MFSAGFPLRSSAAQSLKSRKLKLRSEEIDAKLQLEGRQRKQERTVLLLLLGPPESGKSTVRKQLQLMYDPAGFDAERLSWRAVIYLNIIESVRRNLEALEATIDNTDKLAADDFLVDHELEPDSMSPGTSSCTVQLSGDRVAILREKLAPLLDAESRLTLFLSGNVENPPLQLDYTCNARPRWQIRTGHPTSSSAATSSDRDGPVDHSKSVISEDTLVGDETGWPNTHDKAEEDELVLEVSSTLRASMKHISDLVGLPDVEALRASKRLRFAPWTD